MRLLIRDFMKRTSDNLKENAEENTSDYFDEIDGFL